MNYISSSGGGGFGLVATKAQRTVLGWHHPLSQGERVRVGIQSYHQLTTIPSRGIYTYIFNKLYEAHALCMPTIKKRQRKEKKRKKKKTLFIEFQFFSFKIFH